jgi:hypothetical protein
MLAAQEVVDFWQPKALPIVLHYVEACCLLSAKGAADMKRRYVFRDLDENLITTVESDLPIAHLAVGVKLLPRYDRVETEPAA